MKILFEEKQVGIISYSCGSLVVLYDILANEEIRRSRQKERDFKGKDNYYVSFSRDLLSHARKNPKRWKFVVVIDGTYLSRRYKISPISYTNQEFHRKFRIKYLTKYDDGSCTVSFVNQSTLKISNNDFDKLEEFILKNVDENDPYLIIQDGGKRRVNGRKIVKKYTYNAANGISLRRFNDEEVISHIANFTELHEAEERIWLPPDQKFLDISGSILYVILPEYLKEAYEASSEDSTDSLGQELYDIKSLKYRVTWY